VRVRKAHTSTYGLSRDGPKMALTRERRRGVGQEDRKRCAAARAGAVDGNRSPVHLDEVPRQREPDAEPAELARRAGVRLPEALEDVRQVLGGDADAAVLHADHDRPVVAPRAQRDSAARRRELDRVRQQVPQDLLQPIAIGADGYAGLAVNLEG